MTGPAVLPARPGGQRALRLAAAAILLGALLLLGGFGWFLRQVAAPPPDPGRITDGIATLTGGADRVETGLRLLAKGRARLLLISGTHPDVDLDDLGRVSGLDASPLADRVTLGHAATSTIGNAAEIAAWARRHGLHSIQVVTAGYHMPRALLELHRALPEAELVPQPVTPASLRHGEAIGRLRTWTLLAGEYLKFLGAQLGIARLVPQPPHRASALARRGKPPAGVAGMPAGAVGTPSEALPGPVSGESAAAQPAPGAHAPRPLAEQAAAQ